GGLTGQVGVGADAQLADRVGPLHQLGELLIDPRLLRVHRLVDEHLHNFTRLAGHLAGDDLAGEAVDRQPVALLEYLIADRDSAFVVVDVQGAAADDADLAHLPADERGMAGSAAEGRQNAIGRLHAADVFRAGFTTHQDDAAIRGALVLVDPRLGVLG